MPESLTRTLAASWQAALAELGLPTGPRTVLVGKGIESDIDSFAMMSGPPLAGDHHDVAVFGDDLAQIDLDGASSRQLPLAPDSVDLVVALHAWSDPREIPLVAGEAARVLRPGGGLVLGELDTDRLANSVPSQYGSSLLFSREPDAAARLSGVCLDRIDLEVVLIQQRLLPVRSAAFDRATGVFADRQQLIDAVSAGHWKMTSDLPAERRDSLAALAASVVGPFPYIDSEPWHLVAGTA